MTRRTPRARAYAPDPAAPGRPCDHPGCPKPGEYRAPKSRTSLNEYYWFCLEHVREYNLSWDFYKGMSAAQIEAETRRDTGWGRPTWPLGRLGGGAWEEEQVRDPFNLLREGTAAPRKRREPTPAAIPEPLRRHVHALGLPWPVSMDQLKARWKELAKMLHPDANGGDKAAEERLKTVNLAYSTLRTHLAGAAGHSMAAAG